MTSDPDTGIPDLVRRLTQDSRRLVTDELRLARIEVRESMHRATRGAIWMALALGVGVVMLVALTLFLITLVGRTANGHMWVGALIVGVAELAVGGYLVKRGLTTFVEPSWTLEESRNALADTAHWASSIRRT